MAWFLDIALYVILWWLTLLAVLPWGVTPVDEVKEGHDPGAPAHPNLPKKAITTTVIAALLWYGIHAALVWELARIRSTAY